jgi:MFS family permease
MNTDKIKSTFRAFRNRNYALFFAGQSTSQIGTWMQRTAVSWVVYTMTHSTFMLGLTVFASQAPSFIFSLYGGIVSDRYPRRKILLATQTAAMIQAILLAILILTDHYEVWEILSLSVILGIVNAFDVPARQPLVHELVTDKADIPNAMALNSSMVNIARLVGPALSGIVLQKYGAGFCFLLNAVSFVAVLVSLIIMKLPPYPAPAVKKKATSELVEGLKYLKNTPSIGMVILMLAIVCFLVLPYDTLLPVFAKVVFHGDAATFGYIYSFIGLGAIVGTVFLASMKPGTNLKIILLASTIILGICLMLFSHISYFPLAMVFTVLIGFGTMAQNTICLTIIQVETDPAMRGRVMGWVAMAFFGMMPLGSLLIGAVSQQIGAPDTFLAQGIMALIISAAFYKFLREDKLSKNEKKQFEEIEGTVADKVQTNYLS